MVVLDVGPQLHNRIESLEERSVQLVCGSHLCSLTERRNRTTASQGHATSCASQSPLCWARVVLVVTLLVRTLPGGCASIRISASVRRGTVACRLAGSALPLEPPICTGANTFPVLSSIPARSGFELCPPLSFQPQSATLVVNVAHRLFTLELAHTHDGSIDVADLERDPDFASIMKFQWYCLFPAVFQLVSACRNEIWDSSWVRRQSIRSLAENTHARPRSCPPRRAQHTTPRNGGMVLCVGSWPRRIQLRTPRLRPRPWEQGDSRCHPG